VRIKLLYFAALRDLTRLAEEDLELPPAVDTVGRLREHLAVVHPELAGRLASVRAARNEDFVSDEAHLSARDVVALIPPVAGG
jgi:sulfur-carrier protein